MPAFTRDSVPGRVVFGSGAARSALPGEVAALGVARVLLVATKRGESLARSLAERLPVVDVFTDVREHVPAEVADAALAAARRSDVDCLLSVGGGSALGTAKAVALVRPVPIVAVPTTYAGSEMTPVWGRTEGGAKRTGRSPDVLPRLVVYDPSLTVGLPPAITAASGMNAMAHAVAGLRADPVTALVAREAVRVLTAGLPEAVAEEDRGEALYGAYLAASAFAVAGSGRHHKLCHALGGAYGLPHAPTHAVLLPYTARGTVDGLRELAERIGAPTSLREIGMRAEDLDDAVRRLPHAATLLPDAYEGRWPPDES
ncbi:MAG: iron-containing alcohol dehydrogenase [Actinophytocola sp.]|uniref:iron-containing alcohol dehydrogenase n=1 Tax=Actinophytocola sp. TaxID=1872138 RepID=UPI0013217E3A|nr:iron-containing alcohol dehydrogenase [Actinophytocola sp.]MPZ85039.1 iron-containing alcohol dehydrogenase [Actinophytocola sp.]